MNINQESQKNTISAANMKIASPWKRVGAACMDVAFLGSLGLGIFFILFSFFLPAIPKNDFMRIQNYVVYYSLFFVAGWIGAVWLYFIIITWLTKGGTIGKQALSIQVVRMYGLPTKLMICLSREILKMFLSFIFPIYLLIFFTKEHRGLHDIAARTFVVEKKWKQGKIMMIIGVASIIICIIGGYFAQEWFFGKIAKIMNDSKNKIFSDYVKQQEAENEPNAISKGGPEELFYTSLYNGKRDENEIALLRSLYHGQTYDEEELLFLFGSDSDQDGLSDAVEEKYKTNAYAQDMDGDGISDSEEIKNGTNPTGKEMSPLSAATTTPFQPFQEQQYAFSIQYPVGWNFTKDSSGNYVFGTFAEKDGKSQIEDPLVGIQIEQVPDSSLSGIYYTPMLYKTAIMIEPMKIGAIPAQMLSYEYGARIVELPYNNLIIRIIELIPYELKNGVFDTIVNSFKPI